MHMCIYMHIYICMYVCMYKEELVIVSFYRSDIILSKTFSTTCLSHATVP